MASLSDPTTLRGRNQPAPAVGPGIAPVARGLSHPVMLAMLLLTATQPYLFQVGPLVIGPYRLVLMLISVPLFLGWAQGKYGGRVLPDFLLLGYIVWSFISLIVNGQADRATEFAVSQMFDIFVAYLLGRAAIRSREDFYFFAKFFLGVLLFLLPFAVLESTKGLMILQNIFRPVPGLLVFKPTTLTYPPRLGLMRAMTGITHPIVYGVLCSMAFSLAIVALKYADGGMSLVKRILWSLGSAGGTFFSLSAGAFTGVILQLGLIAWDVILRTRRYRWKLLGGMSAFVYVILDIFGGRPPLVILARYVAFSGETAWNRYMIWQYGTAYVGHHRIFGGGLFTDWERESWMPASVDNHWLLQAMRWGIPGCALLLGMYFYILVRLTRADLEHDPAAAAIRKAFVFIFIGMFFQLGTVLVWQVTYSLMLVMLGGAVWLFNEPDKIAPRPGAAAESGPATPARRGRPVPSAAPEAPSGPPVAGKAPVAYTRFPVRPGRPGAD